MNEGSRKPAETTRWKKARVSGWGFTVAAGDQRLKAKFPGQPAEPDDGEFEDHFPLEGADAGSQGAQGIHMGFTSFYRAFGWGCVVSVQSR